MAGMLVIANFFGEEAAKRAGADLRDAGIDPGVIEFRPGERGIVSLVVQAGADYAEAEKVTLILERHRPELIETKPDDRSIGRSTTLSGAAADYGISAGTVPQAEPDTDWLVRREGKLAEEFDTDPEPNQP